MYFSKYELNLNKVKLLEKVKERNAVIHQVNAIADNGDCIERNVRDIEISTRRNPGKEGKLMSDFEMLFLVLMILSIVVTILIAYINHTKK